MRSEGVARCDLRRAKIIDLTHDGEGVADLGGERAFVVGALPGETVELELKKRRRGHREAALVRIVEPSPERIAPPCEYFGRCGGCALQHLDDAAQLRFKQDIVAQAFARIARCSPDEWLPPITGPSLGYRRRARLGAKFVHGKDRVLVGFRERASPYITDMARCPVLAPPIDALLGELAELIGGSSVRERLPQIEVAIGDAAAALVLRVLDVPSAADEASFREFGERHGVDIYLQPGGPGTVSPLMATPRELSYRLPAFDVTLKFAPTDFVQVNAAVNEQMVEAAVELAEVRATDRVLDLFCGLGNFSLPFARRAAEVVGVEGEAGLVARAVRNAAANGIANTRFLAADLVQTGWPFYREPWDIVVLDPPRTGAEAPVAEMRGVAPRRIVYVSCHPATLARDARVLVHELGFRLPVVRVLDMFPQTHHVEAMALFVRD
jgi:23S rRNA (uracil1939-C5)-methyltransferase